LTNENAQLARVGHQTDRQTAESITGTELGRSVATVSDADSRPGHPGQTQRNATRSCSGNRP